MSRRATILMFMLAMARLTAPLEVSASPMAKGGEATVLDRLIAASASVCLKPDDYGYTASGDLKAGIDAKLPKLLGKLFSFGISGSVSNAYEIHKGVAQKDVGPVMVQQNICAEHVFTSLVNHFALTDLADGRKLERPRRPAEVFRMRQATAIGPSAGGLAAMAGSGGFAGLNNGTVTITNNGPPVVDHRDQITSIALLVKEANQIEENFEQSNDVPAIKASYNSWFSRSDAFLTSQFDASYSAEFEAADGDAIGLAGRSMEGNGYWATLRAKKAVLVAILGELRR